MKKKILFTGNGRVVIDDLMAHVPNSYQRFKCLSMEYEFISALESHKPDVVVVALFKETATMLRMYSDLKDRQEYFHLPILVIGSEEDCATFRRSVFQKTVEYFVRPIDMNDFQNKLDEVSTVYADIKEKSEQAEQLNEKKDVLKKEAVKTGNIKTDGIKKENLLIRDGEKRPDREMYDKMTKAANEASRKNILVVDDDVRMLNVIKMYLEDLYDVTVVPSGKLALKYLSKKKADLVLLDYMMPEMDGPEVLRNIRTGETCPDIPVVFLTGVSDKEQVLKGLELRPDGYILKPAKRETILERVMEILLGL